MDTVSVAIVDYGSGNLHSAAKAFERVARNAGIAGDIQVTSVPEDIRRAERIVLPGVGAFGDCRAGLASLDGMTQALRESVLDDGRPFLGICVGMQLMATRGHEHGDHDGLDWLPGDVVALAPSAPPAPPAPPETPETEPVIPVKIPHMGWNNLHVLCDHPVLDGLDGADFYFVHSYHFKPADPGHLLARVDHGGPVTAVVGRDNMIGLQCHPEKSQLTGLQLIHNFLNWTP